MIIPCFNHGRFVTEAIASVRAQTWAHLECIVVDDGSTDGTGEMLRAIAEIDGRVTYLWQSNAGLSAARNAGLAATRGEFVQFLDADDYIGSGKLAHQLTLFAKRPGADIVYGDVRYFADVGSTGGGMDRRRVARPTLPSVSGDGVSVLAELVRDNVMVVQAPLIRRPLLERVGGFDTSLPRLEDWDCWLRCAMAGASFLHDQSSDPDLLSYVRVRPGSLSANQPEMLKTALQIRDRLDRHLPTQELRRLNQLRTHEQWAQMGVMEGEAGRPGVGVRWLLRASLAERRIKWLMWGALIPALRMSAARRALALWRRRRWRKSSTEASGGDSRD